MGQDFLTKNGLPESAVAVGMGACCATTKRHGSDKHASRQMGRNLLTMRASLFDLTRGGVFAFDLLIGGYLVQPAGSLQQLAGTWAVGCAHKAVALHHVDEMRG